MRTFTKMKNFVVVEAENRLNDFTNWLQDRQQTMHNFKGFLWLALKDLPEMKGFYGPDSAGVWAGCDMCSDPEVMEIMDVRGESAPMLFSGDPRVVQRALLGYALDAVEADLRRILENK